MDTTFPGIKETRVGDVQVLLSRYVAQLVDGCGDSRCTEIHCHTGSLNTTQQPRRRLTSRAARAIAFTICSGQMPKSHLCQHYIHSTSVGPDAERDSSSIVQQLVDTPSSKRAIRCSLITAPTQADDLQVQRLYGSIDTTLEPQSKEFKELQIMHQLLHPLHAPSAHLPGNEFLNNTAVTDILSPCLEWLLFHGAPLSRLAPWYWIDAEVISPGNAYPQVSENMPSDGSYNTWLAILDGLDHEPYLRLLRSICVIVAKRCRLEDALVAANPKRLRDPGQSICSLLASRVKTCSPSPERGIAVLIWLKKLFAQHWDAEPIVKGATCYGILEFIHALYDDMVKFSGVRSAVFNMRFITSHLSATDISQAWLYHAERNAVHLLHYQFLFPTEQLYLIFRTINHLEMSKAHRLVLQARRIREKVTEVKVESINEQQLHAERNCLLFSVSRENMLKDTFDQMWHRRKGELRRPLRVRLGTITELQVGQDLGGVQMEFFNLLCREVLHEQADMFTTNLATGCSYLKAGSSQPLAYFKHFGVLLALAMYNGITLPITLPKIFYHFLIAAEPPSCSSIKTLDDGWPEIAKSLRGLTDEDAKDLDFTFDLSANGVHMSVLSPREDSIKDATKPSAHSLSAFSVLKVVQHYPETFALNELSWPGWTFERSAIKPEEVTPQNRARYIREKIHWHSYVSVAPQLSAILDGFKSADLFPNDTLKHLFSARTLKAYTEGMEHLDIDQLRATATYAEYEEREEYIQSFWRVVSGWPQSKQKQLLKFVTAAERIPISGPSQLVFTIKRAGNPEYLPTSHTCFGTLDLPQYESLEVMDEKLSLALRYGSEGFGMG